MFSLFLPILSISSMKIIPRSAAAISPSAALMSFKRTFSTSSPTYPASVRVVASAIANGTFSFCARVFYKIINKILLEAGCLVGTLLPQVLIVFYRISRKNQGLW